MTTYVPDPREYQQLNNGDPYGGVDCTAWGAAFRLDAHTEGATTTTGRAVRLHTDEPVPDPASPGLNLGQVDAAILDITHDAVDFDTRVQGRTLPRPDVKLRVQDGRFAGLSIWRAVLVDRGFVSGFRGAHDVTLFTRASEPDQALLFDPLVPNIVRVSWDAVFDAAEALAGGRIYAQFTRDVTPDYRWVLYPREPATVRVFNRFLVEDNRIVGVAKRHTRGTDVVCTPPRYVAAAPGKPDVWSRYLVQLVVPGQNRSDWYVDARWAEEQNP